MTLILGVDPGLASGVSIWDTQAQDIVFAQQTASGVVGLAETLCNILPEYGPDVSVWESFQLRAGNKFIADLSSVECIGWAKGQGLWDKGVAPNVHKSWNKLGEKDPKAGSPVTRLMKEQGVPIGAGHTRDALSICIWFACTKLKCPATLKTHARLSKGK